ncbi:DeoR/GlpR family DNA-binding transcription regulator [Paenibacillus validus]|uniref:DeoR family transcriptional regulator n=1 Tax=Paenibacillus validus TaxID=44253 RepID=A0A7X2Z859_9BACL|nr:DeoR/GlpR family DNA-binding transcription regulator [Paenibacillus validus]MED4603733.1 DeoR/GlpR family DNA-binding transcription regulator [Paenibacillus validus]MED4609201.1 DeoR/GlpR family DNA-binding transcription regulator [Paenibacillus validus]MUG69458.1 DeoR family transcriptional regulator [Paenibacillus validus]
MFGEERKNNILSLVEEKKSVDVQELCELYQVSESTIRRDLREMEEAGLLKRTHGGAISVKSVMFEPSFSEKEISRTAEKKAIAAKAAEMIRNGDTILLDAGTTTYYMFRELEAFQKLTVVTNSIILPQDVNLPLGIELIVLGGAYRAGVMSLVGPFAERCLDMIKVDKAFMATNGMDLKEGLTTPNLMEADIKRKMIRRADRVILLSDSSKANQVSFSRFADWSDIDVCITDAGMPGEFMEALTARGIEVYAVEAGKELGDG